MIVRKFSNLQIQKYWFGIIILLVMLFSAKEFGIQSSYLEKILNEANKFENKDYMKCLNTCMSGFTDYPDDLQGHCGSQGEKRGPHQKVVSFVFFGDLGSEYYKGIKENVALLETHYPGWVMRLYVDGQKMAPGPGLQLCQLACDSGRFDICPVNKLPEIGDISTKVPRIWRFVAMADPLVDIFISRDLDSRLLARERAAVDDWLQTGLPFHSMRDHPSQQQPIQGGMFGARLDNGFREKYKELVMKIINHKKSHNMYKYNDQILLADVIWPQIKNEVLVHDSYHCIKKHLQVPNMKPFPTRRNNEPNNFVGSLRGFIIDYECPVECRPKDHQDWTTC